MLHMLSKKLNGTTNGSGQSLNTIIGRGTIFEGAMKVENSVRIDGVFKGELHCSGTLTISQSGEAHAQIEGTDIYVNGEVQGSVRADKVHLDSQARFVGEVFTSTLSITEGAVFQGNCAMENIEKGSGPSNLEVKTSTTKEGQNSSDQLNTPRPTGQNVDAAEEHKKAAAGHK